MKSILSLVCALSLVLSACAASIGRGPEIATDTPRPLLPSPTFTSAPTRTLVPAPTRRPTFTPVPSPTFTSSPYERYTIEYLRARTYGGGELKLTAKMEETDVFKRYAFQYPSDGLKIYGFMDVPKGDGPFPVVILLHGKTDPLHYSTLDYSTPYADDLAAAGYFVLHPNLRNYPPSDSGDNLYRVGMAIDVLNLIALVKSGGGTSGPLAKADPARIGLWGHSMGGGIALKVITISSDVKAAVLYAPLSGDEKLNFEGFFSGDPQAAEERQTNALAWYHISASYFFKEITAAVEIHQGQLDEAVPPAWSEATCTQLRLLQKTVFCVDYPDMGHAFSGMTDKKFIALVKIFFKNYLVNTPAP